MIKRSIHFLNFILALLSTTVVVTAFELPPGRLFNPLGLQLFQGVAYNSSLDEYLVIAGASDFPRARRLGTDGVLIGPGILLNDTSAKASNVRIVYNPDRDGYLAIFRIAKKVYARYLDTFGQPLSPKFLIGTGGTVGNAAYSRTSDRYLVVWRQGPAPVKILFAFVDGDSTAAVPVISKGTLAAGDNVQAAWGSATDRFMVAYRREVGSLKEEVFVKTVKGDGSSFGSEKLVAGGSKSQTSPGIAYSPLNDRFLVTFQDWKNSSSNSGDVAGQLIDSNGNKVGGRFNIKATRHPSGDVNGPVGFSEAIGKFIATFWWTDFGYAREVDPVTGARGPLITLGDAKLRPEAIATRPDNADPQAIVLTRANLGGDGVHGHILHLELPPPTFTSTTMPNGAFGIFYSAAPAFVGGTPPFNFELVSGTLPPGLGGPNAADGVISGTPNAAGTFFYRIRVTDDGGRTDEVDLTHTITLAAPNLVSPISGATVDTTPTFDWDPSPGASTYHLVVLNITSGGTPIDEAGLVATDFTPTTALPAGNLYSWSVQASGGGIQSPFSNDAIFEIDTLIPPPVVLSGEVPDPNSLISGLVAIDTSSEWTSTSVKENLVDGNTATFWNSAGTATNVTEFITADLGADKIVSKIRLRSNKLKRFPPGFQLQISSDDINYTTLVSFSGFVATGQTWYDFDVVPTMGRYVRIFITQKNATTGTYYAQIAEMEVFEPLDVGGKIRYSWLAPVDDAGGGTEPVASYDLRVMKTDVPFDYNSATPVTGEPEPGVFGTPESLLVQNLDHETEYAAAVTSLDDAGNRSVPSNVFIISTQGIAPGPITGLQVVVAAATGTSIRLQWIAPPDDVGDNSSGPIQSYDVRCSTSPIPDVATFDTLPALGGPIPAQPGNTQIFDVPDLANQTNYHCGVRAFDDAGLSSHSGMTVQGSTLDTIAPNQVSGLQGSFKLGGLPVVAVEVSSERLANPKEFAIDGDVSTHWSSLATGSPSTQFIKLDFGAVTDMNLVRLRSDALGDRFPRAFTIELSTDDTNWNIVHQETNFPSTGSTWYDFPFGTTSARYVKIEVTKIKSSSVKYRVHIAEIEVFGPTGVTVQATLTWLATGDDGDQGIATSYEIRHSTAQITEANFNGATLPPDVPPVPQAPGFLETFVISSGLTTGTMTWFAVKTSDDMGNSSITVVAFDDAGNTFDPDPPNQVSNLQADFTVGGLSAVAVEVSSERLAGPKEFAIDGDVNTHWSSLATSSPTTQFIKLDFGAVVDMNLVRLRSDALGGDRFPRAFTIELSTDDTNWNIVHQETNFPSTGSTWYDFPFAATLGRYVKIEVTKIKSSAVKYRVQIAEIEVFGPSGATIQATLTWLATGDDGDDGTATSYEIRHSTAEITEANFNGATLPPGVPPVPQAPGSPETFVIGSGLTPGTMTWFGVMTSDEAGNSSVTVVSAVTPPLP